jgi:O-antigen/teichoic acid export membrane protein
LVTSILLARILGKDSFGKLGIIISTINLFSLVGSFGLGATATKYVAEYRQKHPERAGRVLALSSVVAWVTGLLSASAILILAPYLANHSLAKPELLQALRICAPLVLLTAVNGAQTGALSGFESFKDLAVTGIFFTIATLPLQAVGAWKWGIEGALWGQVAGLVLNGLLNFRVLLRNARDHRVVLSFSEWKAERWVLWSFSFPTVLSGLLILPVNWFCAALLVRQPHGFAEMAGVTAGNQWRGLVAFLPALLATVCFPIAASLPKDGRFRKIALRGLALNYGAGLAACLLVVPFRSRILAMYGPNFGSAGPVLVLLMLAGVLEGGNEILFRALLILDKGWWRFISNGLWGAVMLFLSWRWIPTRGALGLASATVVAVVCHFLVQIVMFYRFLPRQRETPVFQTQEPLPKLT